MSWNERTIPASRESPPSMRVLLTTEGTYPYHFGGLSTWCDALMRELADVDFSLLAVCRDPYTTPRFERPRNLTSFRPLPLWGVRSSWEVDPRSASDLRSRRRRTTEAVVERRFLPPYLRFLGQLLGDERDDYALAASLHAIHRFSLEYDFDGALRSEVVWSAFTALVSRRFPAIARDLGYSAPWLTLGELSSAAQWIHHWLFPLSHPIEDVDIAHATMGGVSSMVGVVCKLEHDAAFLLSEHGIYLRECYLAECESSGSLFAKVLKLAFARRMTELAYSYADAVAPCCDYNQRWERRVGVEPERIHTAYYGLDPSTCEPSSPTPSAAPVVVWAGRIDPLKDIETLLRAAALVGKERPEIRFLLYGAAPPGNEGYYERCLALHRKLRLADTVSFEGFSADVLQAYARADLVVLSSISEGFPYSTLEAMLCGRPVVATAVGGVAEQITADCGRVVRPRDPRALSAAILDVVGNRKTCQKLSAAARERATTLFGIERFRATHRGIYELVLASRRPRELPAESPESSSVASVGALEPELVGV